ncbi:MAG: hypothetical protein DRO90_00820 [Candidatus Altiarchaeales archaeon]|nr:MAG: hypothetical protein DRO90_00820 [Candidatus Altiarchaeales archaeon]
MIIEIETYGCAMNRADSEAMRGLLEREGFNIGKNGDILIVNTCTVKTPTERKIIKRLKKLEESGRRVIVTGCLPAAYPEISNEFKRFSFLGMNIQDIVKAVKSIENGKRFVKISDGKCRLEMPRVRENPVVEIIPISHGCLGNCTYCITKEARGKLNSYPIDLILERAESAIAEGVREIWLTSQDTGAYGIDKGIRLPDLLGEISKIEGKFKIRIGMMNPNHALEILDELINAYRSDKIYKFLHIPVQSGNDRILRKMNRKYSVDDFRKIVLEFRENFPRITIATDVIAGFPGETEGEFRDTLKLINELKPDIVNISRFWPRPRTEAERMRTFPSRITKDRSRILTRLFRKIGLEKNKEWMGWRGEALVSESKKDGSFCARNFSYKPIIIRSENDLMGKFVNVKIREVTYFDLRGEII